MQRWQPTLALVAAGLFAGAGSLGCGSGRVGVPAARSAARHPNVVVILTDDQTLGSVNREVTPNIDRWFVRHGRSYPNAFATDPLCAPSRASIMTGRYAHDDGVRGNDAASFHLDMRSEIQCYLRAEGYSTGYYGKFYNGYDYARDPPCLSDYAITRGDTHTGLRFNIDGETVTPPGWQDDDIGRRAVAFLDRRALHPTRPFFLVESMLEPHPPYGGLPERVASKPVPAPFESPSVWEPAALMARKPPAVREHATMQGYATDRWGAEERMLMNVDRNVGALFAALARNHQLADTLVVFLSDNGSLFGEHHLIQKRLPYTESMGVPAYLYGPRWVGSGATTDARLLTGVDVVPTIIQAAGIRPRLRHELDGRSLLRTSWHRPYVVGESWHLPLSAWQPRWRGIRSASFQYIEYLTDGRHPRVTWREYYDLTTDPYEMRNLLADGDRANNPDVALLHARTVAASHCRGTHGAHACR